jgi:hypothetical protein
MLSYSIDEQRRLVEVWASGVVTAADIRALQDRGRRDPQYDPRMAIVFDLTAASKLEWSADDLRMIAATSPAHPSACRALVAGDDVAFGLARMLQTFTSLGGHGDNVRVFRHIAEARAWALSRQEVLGD